MPRIPFATAVLLAAAALPCHGQAHKRFMGGPVTLEDQGSFFVGGVTKVSEYAAVPGAPPGQPTPPRTPQQITIGQMYVQFQIPARIARAGLARDHGARLDAHGRRARVDARRPRGLVSVLRAQRRRDLRRRSIGPRPLGVRSVRAARGRGAAPRRQPRRRRRAAADVRSASPTTARIRPGSAICCPPARRSPRAGWSRTARPRIRKARARPRSRTSRRCFRSRPSTSTTSSSCRTPRRRCPARRARPACRRSSRRPTRGRRRTWRCSSSASAARSSRRTRSPASWVIT